MSEAATVHPEHTIACSNHPMESAVTRCKSCSRPLCPVCWQRTVDREPWCELCIADLDTGARARWPLAITLLAIAALVTLVGWRGAAEMVRISLILFAVIVSVLAIALVVRGHDRPHGRTVAKRAPDDAPPFDASASVGHPYRARVKRAAKLLAPPLALKGCGVAPDIGLAGCEAIVPLVLAFIAAMLALVAAWLLVELLAPAVFFLAYLLVRGALARVANDDHGCERDLPRALGWGALWVTVYVAPLALVIWAVQLLAR